MRIDPKHVEESLKEAENKEATKPETRAGRIFRNIITVILVVGLIALMVYLVLNR